MYFVSPRQSKWANKKHWTRSAVSLYSHTILLFLLFILFIFLSEKKDIKQRERLWRVSSQWSWASKFHLTTPNRTCSLWRFCLLKSISLFIEKHIPSHGNSLAHRHDIGVILGFYWRDIGLLLAWYWAFGNTDRSVGFTQVSLPLSFTQVSLPLSFTQVFTQVCRWDLHKFTQVSLPLSAYSSQQRERDRRGVFVMFVGHIDRQVGK